MPVNTPVAGSDCMGGSKPYGIFGPFSRVFKRRVWEDDPTDAVPVGPIPNPASHIPTW